MDSAKVAQPQPNPGLPDQAFRRGPTLERVLAGAAPFDDPMMGAPDDLSDEEWDAFTAAITE